MTTQFFVTACDTCLGICLFIVLTLLVIYLIIKSMKRRELGMNTATLTQWQSDTAYYALVNGELVRYESCSEVPDELFEAGLGLKISDAVSDVQKRGCQMKSLHVVDSVYYANVLAVLKMAVDKYGETFPVLYRGIAEGSTPDSQRLIFFGTTQREVAEFYGDVQVMKNVRGLKTLSLCESVTGNDQMDEEVIFF